MAAAGGLRLLIRSRLRDAAPQADDSWRAWAIWGMQSALVALLLLLLWQPAMTVAELSSQQNIIAVVVDDSRSMAIADSDGKTREAAALAALEGGVARRAAASASRRASTGWTASSRAVDEPQRHCARRRAATHIGDGLKQLATETADLPVGAVVLLSDGGENTAGLGGSGIGAGCAAGAAQSPPAGAHRRLRQASSPRTMWRSKM